MLKYSPTIISDSEFPTLFIDHPLYTLTPNSLALEIEKTVKTLSVDYLEALTIICEKYEIEYTAVPKLLTATMKDKIEMAAEQKNKFKKHLPPSEEPDFFVLDDESLYNDEDDDEE